MVQNSDVAQMARAADSYSAGHGFDSRRRHYFGSISWSVILFSVPPFDHLTV